MIHRLRFHATTLLMVWSPFSSSLCSQVLLCVASGLSPVVSNGHGNSHNTGGRSTSPPSIPLLLRRIRSVNLRTSTHLFKLQANSMGVEIAGSKHNLGDPQFSVPGPCNRKFVLMDYLFSLTAKFSAVVWSMNLVSDEFKWFPWQMYRLPLKSEYHIARSSPLQETLLFYTTTNPLVLRFNDPYNINSGLHCSVTGNNTHSHYKLRQHCFGLDPMDFMLWYGLRFGLGSQTVTMTYWDSPIRPIDILVGIPLVLFIGWMGFGSDLMLDGFVYHSDLVIDTHLSKLSYWVTVNVVIHPHDLQWNPTVTFRLLSVLDIISDFPELVLCLGLTLLDPPPHLYTCVVREVWNLDRWFYQAALPFQLMV